MQRWLYLAAQLHSEVLEFLRLCRCDDILCTHHFIALHVSHVTRNARTWLRQILY